MNRKLAPALVACPHLFWLFLVAAAWLPLGLLAGGQAAAPTASYAIVVSKSTQSDHGWARVVEALRDKHQAAVISYDASAEEALPKLRQLFPRYVCFVARPEEASRALVARAHRITRRFDQDPYTDCFWGILTGYDATNALRIAQQREPLTIRKVAAGTELALDMVEEGVWYCELNQGKMVKKEPGKPAVELRGPEDATQALVDALNEYHADLFVTSGHATEHDWAIGYRYRGGSFRHENGRLYGLDTQRRKFPIHSPNPKVYLPIGNCLMGHIDRPDCMALSWMNSAGVDQMLGYTLPTWYGYMGWGVLDYFVEQPGRYTFTEAFFANQAALIHRLTTYFPELAQAELDESGRTGATISVNDQARAAGLSAQDGRGLLFDRDTVAFYGDPAWGARLADGPRAWEQNLSEQDGLWTFEIKPNRGERTFDPINQNGSQRGGRPIVQFLPRRIQQAKILEGADLRPVITDDFILIPNPHRCDPARSYRVRFEAALVR